MVVAYAHRRSTIYGIFNLTRKFMGVMNIFVDIKTSYTIIFEIAVGWLIWKIVVAINTLVVRRARSPSLGQNHATYIRPFH